MTDQSIAALLAAWHNPARRLTGLPQPPRTSDEVRAIQRGLLAELGPVGGYKVGSAGAVGDISYAPLPARCILPNNSLLNGMRQRWVEAEIAVTFARDLPPDEYAHADILEAIGTLQPAIEVLDTRFADPAGMDALSLLADLGMHGALILGEPGHWPDLSIETVDLLIDGAVASQGQGHPAGDMIRLLRHLAQTEGIGKGQVVTTGSWNPLTVAPERSTVTAAFGSLNPVTVRFEP